MTDSTTVESGESQAPAKKAILRTKYTDAFVMKCKSNKATDAPSVMLLTALIGCNIPHRMVDEMFNVPAETCKKYLETGSSPAFSDDDALEVFDMLYTLRTNDAVKASGLDTLGVLKAMKAYYHVRESFTEHVPTA
jgi:hypothetical protein